jgi:hypothetical protein
MPRRSVFDHALLASILARQFQVVSRRQALDCGIPRSTVNSWCTAGGKWQKLLPGVYLTVTGTPTHEQRLAAAMLYAGAARAAITGTAALRQHRLRSPGPDLIDVLVPSAVQRQSNGFVRIHRTKRLPRVHRVGILRFAAPARAVADAARLSTSLDDVKSVVAEAIQKQASSLQELRLELEKGASGDSVRLRAALDAAHAGVRSVAEDRFRERIKRSGLPVPRFNVFLRTLGGTDIGEVDAWWADAGVSVEIDSQEYHFYRADWIRTDVKRSRLLSYGILAHNIAPARVENDWDSVCRELRASLDKGRQRPRLDIVAFEPSA